MKLYAKGNKTHCVVLKEGQNIKIANKINS
jgi:hypothetical protein